MRRAVLVSMLILASCRAHQAGPEPTTTITQTETITSTPTPTLKLTHHDVLGVGFTLIRTNGDQVRVNAIDSKRSGDFIGVQLELTNTGRTTWTEQPYQASLLRDDKTYAPAKGDQFTPAFGAQVTLEPGQFRRAWLGFRVGTNHGPFTFRFTPDGGKASDIAEWDLR